MFLEQRKLSYEEHISRLEESAIGTNIKLKEIEDELARMGAIVAEFEIDGTPLFLLGREQLEDLDMLGLPPRARQIAANLLQLRNAA